MGYRDELIRRLQESGEWDTLTPEGRQEIERFNDEKARFRMAAQDAVELGLVTCSDDERESIVRDFVLMMLGDAYDAFDGGLLLLEPGKAPRLSGLGRALAEFIATAKDHGFPDHAVIAEQLSLVTQLCVTCVARLAKKDQA